MSTIEGGMVCTNDTEFYEKLVMLRSHGWARDVPTDYNTKWNVSDFDSSFTFYSSGFNLRSTEINAFLGINQLNNIDKTVQSRHINYRRYNTLIKNDYWKPKENANLISNMGYPLIHPKRNLIAEKLKSNGIECRPLVSGSMWNQPFFIQRYSRYNYYYQSNSRIVSEFGMYLPNHPDIEEDITFICDLVNKCIND